MGAGMKKGRYRSRRGKAAAPYTKYRKTPYQYSSQYYHWRANIKKGA